MLTSPSQSLRFLVASVCVFVAFGVTANAQNKREAKLRADKERFDSKRDWIYNDLERGLREAKTAGKPLMVVLRCVPCEECVKLDDDLIDNDPTIAPMMNDFVRVRLTGTNGLDLQTFQYDTDQSFAVMFLNADKTVYGRFGTRSHRTEWTDDVSVEALAEAMKTAQALHKDYPNNRDQLRAKSNQPTEFRSPEKFPTLSKKPDQLNWEGPNFEKGVLQTCIHCHEISEARMEFYWKKREPIPERVLYPYPHPKSIGLILNPKHAARVTRLQGNSPVAGANLKPGDDIVRMNGQPVISIADVQWVLHNLPSGRAKVELDVRRNGQTMKTAFSLAANWRRKGDTTWRTGHWILRRSMLGGMKLAADKSGLRVEHVGNWGPFGVAKRSGVRKHDLIVSIDGHNDLKRESDVFDYINESKRPGQTVRLVLKRGGRQVQAAYKIQ